MGATASSRVSAAIHPLQAAVLAGTVPLFLGGLISDLAYSNTAEVQWSNFASWLIAGAMVFTGFALLGAIIALVRGRSARGWPLLCLLLLIAVFVLGMINSFVHARDAWAIMPAAPILSAIVTLLAIAATWIGFASLRRDRTI